MDSNQTGKMCSISKVGFPARSGGNNHEQRETASATVHVYLLHEDEDAPVILRFLVVVRKTHPTNKNLWFIAAAEVPARACL